MDLKVLIYIPVKINKATDSTGEWRLNECESNISQRMVPANTPIILVLVQKLNSLIMKSVAASGWPEDEIIEQTLTLDDSDNKSVAFMNSQRIQNAGW